MWGPVHTRRSLLRHQPAGEVDLRCVDPRGTAALTAHLAAVFLCGAFSSSASRLPTYQLRERTDFLASPPPTNPLGFSATPRLKGINVQSLTQAWDHFNVKLVSCLSDNTDLTGFPPPLARLICCRWTGFNLNEPADILLFLRIRPFFLSSYFFTTQLAEESELNALKDHHKAKEETITLRSLAYIRTPLCA